MMDDGRNIVVPYEVATQDLEHEERIYDLADEFNDEPVADVIAPSSIKDMNAGDKKIWVAVIQKELGSLKKMFVYQTITRAYVKRKYLNQGIDTNTIPGQLVTTRKPLFDQFGRLEGESDNLLLRGL